jgi:hypothetical protein
MNKIIEVKNSGVGVTEVITIDLSKITSVSRSPSHPSCIVIKMGGDIVRTDSYTYEEFVKLWKEDPYKSMVDIVMKSGNVGINTTPTTVCCDPSSTVPKKKNKSK